MRVEKFLRGNSLSNALNAASDSFVVSKNKKKKITPISTHAKKYFLMYPTHQVSFQSSRNVHGTWMTSPGLPHPADCWACGEDPCRESSVVTRTSALL